MQNQDSSGNTLGSNSSAKLPLSGAHIVNLYLQKGTIPVFMEMADNFFSKIKLQLENQERLDSADHEMSNQIDHAMTASNTNFASSNDINDMGGKKNYELPVGTNFKFNLTVVN